MNIAKAVTSIKLLILATIWELSGVNIKAAILEKPTNAGPVIT